MISKTESGRVSKEIPGNGSGSGTRWALHVCTRRSLRTSLLSLLSIKISPSCLNSSSNIVTIQFATFIPE